MPKQDKEKQYTEGQLIATFGLTRLIGRTDNALLNEWLTTETTLSLGESELVKLKLICNKL
ncbi:MAG: hypothetical protein ACKVTZ_05080 [Bacteroidia bacterium]